MNNNLFFSLFVRIFSLFIWETCCHGYLIDPPPRYLPTPGSTGPKTNLPIEPESINGCFSSSVPDKPPLAVSPVWTVGQLATITWTVTVAHNDNPNTGVRVSLKDNNNNNDSF